MDQTSRGRTAHPAEVIIDLTDDAPWLIASAGVTEHERHGRRRFGRRSEPVAAPTGLKHAYRPGATATACGLAVTDLHAWDQRFGDGLLNRCPECLQVSRPGTPAQPVDSSTR